MGPRQTCRQVQSLSAILRDMHVLPLYSIHVADEHYYVFSVHYLEIH